MGITAAKIKKMVQGGFDKLGDLVTYVTYVSVTPGTYDPTTGMTADQETEYPNTRVMLVDLDETEVSWFPGEKETQKVLIAALDLPAFPTISDYLLIDGVRWQVKRRRPVPGGSLHKLFIQEP